VNVADVRQPARVRIAFRAPTAALREGASLRFKAPAPWPLRGGFLLPERRHPLRFGALSFAWRYEIETPPGWTPKRLPSPERIEARCLRFERSAETAAGKVVIEQRLVAQCDEIPPAEYAQHRSAMESIDRQLAQDLVLEGAEAAR